VSICVVAAATIVVVCVDVCALSMCGAKEGHLEACVLGDEAHCLHTSLLCCCACVCMYSHSEQLQKLYTLGCTGSSSLSAVRGSQLCGQHTTDRLAGWMCSNAAVMHTHACMHAGFGSECYCMLWLPPCIG
jgi:hypothetical protein